jgi:type IV secretory pathway VirB2 component (pilin)
MISKFSSFAKKMPVGLLLIASSKAFAGVSVGKGGGAGFDIASKWLQNWVDFMTGPFGIAVVITSLIIAFGTWAMMPKEGIVAPVLRVVVSGIAILNVVTWLATLQG